MLERTNHFLKGIDVSLLASGNKSPLNRVIQKIRSFGWIFAVVVIIPTATAAVYFGLVASDVYISESRFIVRSPDKPSASGFGQLLKSAGFSNTGDEIFAAQEFVQSRDALKMLNRKSAFEQAFSGYGVSVFDRFGTIFTGHTFEDLYKYYRSKVEVAYSTSTSIATLTTKAYSPQEARRMNEQLLEMAEATVNRLNERGREDLIKFALVEVADAKNKARAAALALSAYRTEQGIVDPEKQATVQLQMISKLQDELIAAKTQLVQLRTIAPSNPQIEVLQARVRSLSAEIDAQLGKVTGDRQSLVRSAVEYQRLALESQFADRQLASAMTSLEDAQNEARRKQAYVERIVQPDLPDRPLEPRRWRNLAATFALGLVAWGILSMLFAGVREHQD